MRILLVEDDLALATQMSGALAKSGYAVDMTPDGTDAHHLGTTEPYDAVILDLGLPGLDGLTVLQRWRADGHDMPVLVLTARDRWHEKVAGIDAGADDYVTKPFRMEELTARLRAIVRRSLGYASAVLECGSVSLDTRSARVTARDQPVTLTSLEYRLLSYLMHHQGRVISRTELTEHLYDQDFDRDSNTIEVFVARLRKKLGAGTIHTVRGLGYRLGTG